MLPHFKDTRFWLSGQVNFIFQTHPDFHADYGGPNSLSPRYEKATSRVMTLYTGVRLNNSTELLVDIEEAGGQALSTGLGLAGNTDLDIVRNPSSSKAPYLGRAMFHKVFAVNPGYNRDRGPVVVPSPPTASGVLGSWALLIACHHPLKTAPETRNAASTAANARPTTNSTHR